MSFLSTFSIPLDSFHRQRLRQIDDFDYTAVRKKVAREHRLAPQQLDQGIENLKRYYAVALLDPYNLHAVSAAVDPFWHSHILFTSEYQHFCQQVFGQYIHHAPLDPDDTEQVAYVQKLYDYTIGIYNKVFQSVDPTWWPTAGMAGYQMVCLHYDVLNAEVRRAALFPRTPEFGGRP